MFIITAIVQPAKDAPWLKVAYASNNNDVQWHMQTILQKEYFDVASVKSDVVTDSELDELRYNRQGNTAWINNAPVTLGGTDNDTQGLPDDS